jgi:gamma-glutamyltranspeptidase
VKVETDAPLDEAARASLRARGHVLEEVGHLAIVQAIRIVRGDDAHLEAASDPRAGAAPAGR